MARMSGHREPLRPQGRCPDVADVQAAVQAAKEAAEQIYGDRLDQVILFGSHARGEATERSDIDLLIVLEGPVDPYEEIDRLSEPVYEIELEHGVLLGIVPASTEDYVGGTTPLMRNARREGVPA